jgi:type II secretory pathway pseudopilin PulG
MLIVSMSMVAALVPTIASTVRRAETVAATSAMTDIRNQVIKVLSDINYTTFTIDGTKTGTDVQLLVSDGDTPRECTAIATACTSWQAAVDDVTGLTDFIERHLVTNNPRGDVLNDYPVTGNNIWKGPYLNSPNDPDPWGNRYMVNVQFLGPNTNDVVVLSAGLDEVIGTAFASNPLAAGGDDIIVLVEG